MKETDGESQILLVVACNIVTVKVYHPLALEERENSTEKAQNL